MKHFSLVCLLSSLALASLVGCATHTRLPGALTEPPSDTLAPLPEPVTSFGAVTADGWLYVFGGHKGERHEYSADMVSGSFHRLKLSDGRAWESLPSAAPGQGLALVAHERFIYRVGGMAAHNHAGEKQDLYSLPLVQRYDPRARRWDDVASLPAPRSSHDAVVIGNKLYVVGGWQLSGGTNKPVWPASALVLDLAHPQSGWKEFPQPFQRRALALAALGSRIYCIGGMDSNNKTTLSVEIFDTATGQWSKGPDLPPGENKGFACSAVAQHGRIYVTCFKGDLLRLSADEKSWEVVGRLKHPRMAHRLVTAGATQLIALGGEDGERKRPDLELLTPAVKPLAAKPAGDTAQATPHLHQ
jgi:N-acetylneuraminic acid mutarotase